jgi:outer membrane protein OmpA-like peptidoglycan-associated protein
VVGGVETEILISKSLDGKALNLGVKNVQMQLSGSIASPQNATDLAVNAKAGSALSLSGGGLLANSNMKVFALVNGQTVELSALKADASGKFAVSVGLKSNLPSGTHTLQIAAIQPDGTPVVINQVLTVLPTFSVTTSPSAFFESGSVKLSAVAKKQLAAKAAKLANRKNITVTVTGYVSASNFKSVYANTAKARAQAVVNFLKTQKVIGKFVVKWAKSPVPGVQAMRADISVKSSN